MNIKQLATNFDVLYRRVSDRSKVTEVMLGQLFERSEAEEKYHKALEKISSQMQNGGGDIDDLVKGVKIDLNQRAQYYKQFNQSYKHDVEQAINELRQIQSQFKPLIQDVLKMDKEIKITCDKYDRQKEKTLRASKEYEESAITLEAFCWNKECNMEQRSKAQHKLNSQLQYKQENESALRLAASIYNQAIQSYCTSLQNGIQQLTTQYNQIFAIAKDIVMKILVYEISKTRNLQYDSEQFFKQAEIYQDPQNDPITPGPSSQIGISKENYIKVSSQLNSSFLRNIADQISLNHKLNIKRETIQSSIQVENLDSFDLFLVNPEFIDDLKVVTIKLIGKVNNKNKPKNADEQPAGIQQMVNKYKGQYGEQQLVKIYSFIKYVIQSTQEQQIKGWKNIPELQRTNLDEIFDSKFFRELGCIILESFRQAGCSNLSSYGFKNMHIFTQKLLEISQKEGELILVKRIITMISTIYTIDEHEKRFFLQDSLISMQIWKQIDLWEGLIYTTIETEIDKSATMKDNVQFQNEQILKDKNVIYSNLLTLTLNMINFKVDKQEIKNVLVKYARTQELIKFAENDGKIEPNQKVNSLSVLQSLYHQPQTNQNQQGNIVQNKVVLFDKKNPLSINPNTQVQKPSSTQVYFGSDTVPKEVIQSQFSQNITQQQTTNVQQQAITITSQNSQQQKTSQKSPTLQQQQPTSPKIQQQQQEYEQPKIRYNQHPLEVPKANFLKKLP
ncbi:unnamed protein product [Paramecium pentaurelia]|uniref:F-BAR domain-containing protein n=1 Tax=Paramecium pentaurelia TaxID=43138 RepID=A0A8S1T6C7_9CILI|nr:unnamed protein product [Paramecium pentaurelia]